MKILTFVVPCYNSAAYMDHCISTLLACGNEEDIEIIIVNDGSKDDTAKIADSYGKKYPKVVRVIHQENGGHGEGVNQGIRNATGKYFKVVDSDDWIDVKCGKALIGRIKELMKGKEEIDLFICNYVYEHSRDNSQVVMDYRGILPENKIIHWAETKRFSIDRYLLMHSLLYRTEVVRKSGLELPKHTFYVDNLFAYVPLPFVKSIYYMDLDLYRYFIGRDDQSVNEAVMVKRVDQQLRVTNAMLDAYDISELIKTNKRLGVYMRNYLAMMVVVCQMLLLVDGSEEALQKKKELWKHIKQKDEALYRHFKYESIALFMNLPGKLGRKLGIGLYRIASRIYKFN